MVQAAFVSFVTDIFAYYQRERPKDNTMDLWFDEVRRIPDESLDWISSKIFKESERLPTNLPAMTWALYNAWLAAHPEKRAFKEAVNCPDCEGGWLALQKKVDGYRQPISHSAPCGKCRQIPAAKYMTLFQAREQGYERIELTKWPETGPRDIKELADRVGQKMPEMPRVHWD